MTFRYTQEQSTVLAVAARGGVWYEVTKKNFPWEDFRFRLKQMGNLIIYDLVFSTGFETISATRALFCQTAP